MMKKLFITLTLFIAFPLSILAYSEYIIPGGENVGIKIETKGVLVIGFYKVDGNLNKGNPNIKPGDVITKVNNIEVNTINELTKEIESSNSDSVNLTVKRNDEVFNVDFDLIKIDNVYKTGLYVKDSLTGIGTLTYIDPNTLIYGALGHEIVESNTNQKIEVKSGDIFKSSITSIEKSTNGTPGGKRAKFYYNVKYGSIEKNTTYGIYGVYKETLPNKDLLEVATKDEVKLGKAYIYTVLKDNRIETFEIDIKSIKENNKIKNLYFEITDEELLTKTGGIVQGMSGSPIIQDNKIIGAVTHVIVDDVTTGYGIYITTMLEEGEN